MNVIVAALAIAIVAWFAAGTIWNVRRGRELMRWMQGGLPALGGRTTVRWLGSTAVEMAIRDAREPFASVTLVIFLEARDLPWMWAIGKLTRRRDTLIVRGTFREAPKSELEALEPESWSGREARPRVPSGWPAREAGEPGGLRVHAADERAFERAQALLAIAREAGLAPSRLALHRTEPHFQLHVPLPEGREPAGGFFASVRRLADAAIA